MKKKKLDSVWGYNFNKLIGHIYKTEVREEHEEAEDGITIGERESAWELVSIYSLKRLSPNNTLLYCILSSPFLQFWEGLWKAWNQEYCLDNFVKGFILRVFILYNPNNFKHFIMHLYSALYTYYLENFTCFFASGLFSILDHTDIRRRNLLPDQLLREHTGLQATHLAQ